MNKIGEKDGDDILCNRYSVHNQAKSPVKILDTADNAKHRSICINGTCICKISTEISPMQTWLRTILWWIIHYSKEIVASAKLISLPNSTRRTYVGQPSNQHQSFQLFKHRTGLKDQRQSTSSKRDSNLPVSSWSPHPNLPHLTTLKVKSTFFYNCKFLAMGGGVHFLDSNSNFFWTVYTLGQIWRYWPEILLSLQGLCFTKSINTQVDHILAKMRFPVFPEFSLCYINFSCAIFYTKN